MPHYFAKPIKVPVGVSNRHIHLSQEDVDKLFGPGYQLTHLSDLSQTGQWAAQETLTIIGPKGIIQNVRVLGPVRPQTQVEISRTDSYQLGMKPPIRDSGDLAGTPGCTLVGPYGSVTIPEGVILAGHHIHISDQEAALYGLNDKDKVNVMVAGERELCFHNVLVRVHPTFNLELHLDTDEANAAMLKNGDLVYIVERAARQPFNPKLFEQQMMEMESAVAGLKN